MFLLSRAEAEGVPLRREAVYLDDIAEETARALRVLASERQVSLAVDGDKEVAFVGDDGLLRQLVSNLLHNAIRFAKPAGTVTLSVGRSDETLTIRVIDDGPGVAADQRERIFERFVRDPKSGGAGLDFRSRAGLPRLTMDASGSNRVSLDEHASS